MARQAASPSKDWIKPSTPLRLHAAAALAFPDGSMTASGLRRKTQHRGRGLVEWFFILVAAAYNLIRIPKILAAMA